MVKHSSNSSAICHFVELTLKGLTITLLKQQIVKKEVISMLIVRIVMKGYISMLFEIDISITGCVANPQDCHPSSMFSLIHSISLGLFRYPLKASENQRFSDVFKGYRKRTATLNGLNLLQNIFA